MIVDHSSDIEGNINQHPESTADNEAGMFGDLVYKIHQFLHDKENNDSK